MGYTNGTGGSMPKGLCRCVPIEEGACQFQGSRPKYPDCIYEYQCPSVDACWPITTTPTTIAATTSAAAGTADEGQDSAPETNSAADTKASEVSQARQDFGAVGIISAAVAAFVLQ